AAIPETLLEAEMFGFERGAFTDARRAKPGLFQTAHRGTIFLDEVGLLPEALQAKLLKVLEERTVRRLGSTRDEAVDVWIVTATNEDLRTAVRERRFREDLYHRLAVLPLALPPLRERGADIGALAVRTRVAEVLRQTRWNISRSAALLGISRNTLRARIEKYGLKSGVPAPSVPRRVPRPAPRPPVAPPGAPAPAVPAALRWERR